jgi:hypothetical protein
MKRFLLFLAITVPVFNCYSQIEFEKGYFIDNSDQRIECYIKNLDWKSNPTEFEYKLSESSEIKNTNISRVKEFGIGNVSKFIKDTVNIDRSGKDLSQISKEKSPVFKEEVLFLKVLVEGNANLYQFVDEGLLRFFFKMKDAEITQLVYKPYMVNQFQKAENTQFRQQLYRELNGLINSESVFENIDYETNELVRLFVRYNEASDSGFSNFEEKENEKREPFNLNLRPGIKSTSLSIQNMISSSRNADFGTKAGFRFGIEGEFILPFNKNKWAVILEPTYQYFKSELTTDVFVDYKSVELPIGLRYYLFLNKNSRIFVNGSMVLDFPINSVLKPENGNEFEINSKPNMAFGLGYKFRERYSLELRYHSSREILNGYTSWLSDYNTLSVIFGYSIF